jgi:hypothetical protein
VSDQSVGQSPVEVYTSTDDLYVFDVIFSTDLPTDTTDQPLISEDIFFNEINLTLSPEDLEVQRSKHLLL